MGRDAGEGIPRGGETTAVARALAPFPVLLGAGVAMKAFEPAQARSWGAVFSVNADRAAPMVPDGGGSHMIGEGFLATVRRGEFMQEFIDPAASFADWSGPGASFLVCAATLAGTGAGCRAGI